MIKLFSFSSAFEERFPGLIGDFVFNYISSTIAKANHRKIWSTILFTGGSKFINIGLKLCTYVLEKCSEHPEIVIQKLKLILLERGRRGFEWRKGI